MQACPVEPTAVRATSDIGKAGGAGRSRGRRKIRASPGVSGVAPNPVPGTDWASAGIPIRNASDSATPIDEPCKTLPLMVP